MKKKYYAEFVSMDEERFQEWVSLIGTLSKHQSDQLMRELLLVRPKRTSESILSDEEMAMLRQILKED